MRLTAESPQEERKTVSAGLAGWAAVGLAPAILRRGGFRGGRGARLSEARARVIPAVAGMGAADLGLSPAPHPPLREATPIRLRRIMMYARAPELGRAPRRRPAPHARAGTRAFPPFAWIASGTMIPTVLPYYITFGRIKEARQMIDWLIEAVNPAKYPWFRDDLIHPEKLRAVRMGAPLTQLFGGLSRTVTPE